jgi:C-terminal peptidase prc
MTRDFRTRLLVALLTALVALAAGRPARAEEKTSGQPYVVVVGIGQYPDKQIKPRPHAEDDAKALYQLFTNKDYLGVPQSNIRLLLGSPAGDANAQPATRDNILKALHWLATSAKPHDPIIFAFIGEGAPLGNSGDRHCYMAVDSTFKGRDKDAVSAEEIGDALKNLKSEQVCAFLDVDFKGFTDAGKGVADPSFGNTPYKEFLGDDGTDEHGYLHGRVVFLATNGLSASLDLKDHGLFTTALLEGLKGGADTEGYEPDGNVTVEELAQFLDKRTHELARENGKTKEQKEQQYWVLSSGTHFVLTTNPKAAAKSKERLAAFDAIAKSGKLPEKIAAEGRHLLERMPKLEAQRKLRKDYQELADGKLTVDKFMQARESVLESTKLKRPAAETFAKEVWEACDLIKDNYVKEENLGEMVAWAVRGLYRRIDEKIPAELEAKLKKAKELSDDDLRELLISARMTLGQREDLDKHKDIDIALQRMLAHLDPYTTYVDKDQLARFSQEIQQSFTGIGIQIRKDSLTDQLLVVTPIKGSPAYKKGLLTGDIITRITRDVDSDGKTLDPPEVIETKGLALNDAVKKILGTAGTKVHLTVQREGVAKPLEFDIVRGRVEVDTVLGWRRNPENDEWDYMLDPVRKIGYVRLTSFSRHTARDLQRVMNDLTKEGLRGMILDLRFNPGGLLDSAVKISDLFVDDGLIVTIRPRVGHQAPFKGNHEGSLLDFPMVCLVNGYSASGSEIVSAALQDHKRALIVGERSYGKGSVQNIQEFHDGQIKLTTASFWRPSGKNLNKSSTTGKDEDEWGVTPDKVVKLSRKELKDLEEALHDAEIIPRRDISTRGETKQSDFKDRQLDEAVSYLRDQIKTAAKLGAKTD